MESYLAHVQQWFLVRAPLSIVVYFCLILVCCFVIAFNFSRMPKRVRDVIQFFLVAIFLLACGILVFTLVMSTISFFIPSLYEIYTMMGSQPEGSISKSIFRLAEALRDLFIALTAPTLRWFEEFIGRPVTNGILLTTGLVLYFLFFPLVFIWDQFSPHKKVAAIFRNLRASASLKTSAGQPVPKATSSGPSQTKASVDSATPSTQNRNVSNGLANFFQGGNTMAPETVKVFGIAALAVAILSLVVPVYGVHLSGLALIFACVSAWGGDRAFATVTPLIAGVNVFFLSPSLELIYYTNPGSKPGFLIFFALCLGAPFLAMALSPAGKQQNS